MTQEHLFDPDQAAQARDEAIDRIEISANGAWQEEAQTAIETVCKLRKRFTTDPVWYVLQQRGCAGVHDNRAMGAAMRRAAAGDNPIIKATDQFKNSVRVEAHRGPKRIWESLIYEGA